MYQVFIKRDNRKDKFNSEIIYLKNLKAKTQIFESSCLACKLSSQTLSAGHCFPAEAGRTCWYLAGGFSEAASRQTAATLIGANIQKTSAEICFALQVWVYPQLTSV